MPGTTPAPYRLALTIERAFGVVMLVPVIGIYAFSLSHDKLPPGHPWSGITLTLLALRALFFPMAAMAPGGTTWRRGAGLAVALLSIVSAGLWAVSAGMALR